MALADKKIANNITYHQDNPTVVIGQANAMKVLFDKGAEDIRVKLNAVIDEILSAEGAAQIGIDPAKGLGNTLAEALTAVRTYMDLGATGITANVIGTGSGTNVQSQLQWLLLQIQNVLLDQIPDGTITKEKLSTFLQERIDYIAAIDGDLASFETLIDRYIPLETTAQTVIPAINELNAQSAQDVQNLVDHVNNGTTAHGVENKVAKTGDAMTGSLEIRAVTRHLDLKPANDVFGWVPLAFRNFAGAETWRTAISVQADNNISFNNLLGVGEFRIDDKRVYHAGNTGGFYTGNGSPEGTVTAPIGSIYQRKDGGANTTLYVKQSGTGNTGWVAK